SLTDRLLVLKRLRDRRVRASWPPQGGRRWPRTRAARGAAPTGRRYELTDDGYERTVGLKCPQRRPVLSRDFNRRALMLASDAGCLFAWRFLALHDRHG